MQHTKLIIQIPCYNESTCLATTVAALPRLVPGVDTLEIMVVDDGSTDNTVELARSLNVHHVVTQPGHVGLAQTFCTGLKAAVAAGADIIVNLDADNQYSADDIGQLVQPILERRANVVIGQRDLQNLAYMNATKRFLHRAGNALLRVATGLPVRDATSGFRAMDAATASAVRIYSRYTYTIEMLFLLRSQRVAVEFVPIRCNSEVLRPSRLIRSNLQYCLRSAGIILRSMYRYRPAALFTCVAVPGLLIVALLVRGNGA